MKVQRKLIKCSFFIFLLVGLIGCGKAERRFEDAQIVSIQYSYGSYHSGYYDFSVYPSNDKIMFSAFGKNGVELAWKHEVDATILSDLQQIIEDNKVVKWDGFRKSNRGILDGYSFSLNIEYNNQESIQAQGYEKYPKQYDEVSNALEDYFFDILEENTTFDRQNPFKKSTAYDYLATLGVEITSDNIQMVSLRFGTEGKLIQLIHYFPVDDYINFIKRTYTSKNYYEDEQIECSFNPKQLKELDKIVKKYGIAEISGYVSEGFFDEDIKNKNYFDLSIGYEGNEESIDLYCLNGLPEGYESFEEEFLACLEQTLDIEIERE